MTLLAFVEPAAAGRMTLSPFASGFDPDVPLATSYVPRTLAPRAGTHAVGVRRSDGHVLLKRYDSDLWEDRDGPRDAGTLQRPVEVGVGGLAGPWMYASTPDGDLYEWSRGPWTRIATGITDFAVDGRCNDAG